jgi:hypothetical protein
MHDKHGVYDVQVVSKHAIPAKLHQKNEGCLQNLEHADVILIGSKRRVLLL